MRFARPLCLAAAVLSTACGSDSSETPVSPGRVTLRITALAPHADVCWKAPHGDAESDGCKDGAVAYDGDPMPADPGDPMPIAVGCDRALGVAVHIENFYLRAPDACGGAVQCGFLAVDMYDASFTTLEASARGAALTLLLDLHQLDLGTPSDHVLVPSLLRPNLAPFTGPYSSEPAPLPVTLTSVDGCSTTAPSGSGGAGGESSAASGAAGQ